MFTPVHNPYDRLEAHQFRNSMLYHSPDIDLSVVHQWDGRDEDVYWDVAGFDVN